jgi:Ser/Thr protein kinase RdoA (MazF antagonist)
VAAGVSFEALTRAGQTRRLRPLAQAVLWEYPLSPVRVARLPAGFNTAFRVETADGARYVLLVHRPDGPTTGMVRSELAWLAALRRETGLVAPAPLPTRGGDLLAVAAFPGIPEPRTCDLLHWVDGRFVNRRLSPGHLSQVGKYMALLQVHGARMAARDGFERGLVDNVTRFARTQPDNLSAEVAAHAAELVAEVHSASGRPIVRAVLDRGRTRHRTFRRR